MNWDAIGAIGEILGALAVVATIVYLARQVKDNSRQVKLNTTQSYASLAQDAYSSVYTNEKTLRAWLVGTDTPEELDPDELQLFFYLMDRQLNNVVPLINHYREGAMSREEFDHYKNAFLDLVSSKGGEAWISQGRLSSLFQVVIQNLRDT